MGHCAPDNYPPACGIVGNGKVEVVAAVPVGPVAWMRLGQRRADLEIAAEQVVGGED